MSSFHEGRVIENRHWTEALFSLRIEGVSLSFRAGQFVRIGIEPALVRAFSFVNPPQDPVLEFYGIVVPEGPLSPRLARLRLARDDEGQMKIKRTYTFEFSDTGNNRRHGAIVMLGAQLADLHMEPYPVQ